VRSLPKSPVPPDLLARVRSGRVRGDAPRRDWVFLPPSLRPAVLALSCGVVALWIWQDVVVRTPIVLPAAPAARLASESEAPLSQVDVSGPAGGRPADAASKAASDALGLSPTLRASASLTRARAKGRALDEAENSPAAAAPQAVGAAAGSGGVMSEQARSARNIEMFGDLERQKKEMGIAAIASGDGASSRVAALRGAGILPAEPAPSPVVAQRTPRMMAPPLADKTGSAAAAAAPPSAFAADQQASPLGRPAPDAGLVFTDARSLASSWVLLGFPKSPPDMDFTVGRVVLIKPSVSRIVSVTTTADAVIVVYRTLAPDEASDPTRDRFAPIPLTPAAVQIIDATPH
jgi:hypothetical protein